MFVGGCAGSTAGGIKVSRIVLLFKGLKRDLRRILHTREVRPITLDGQRVEEDTISSVSLFFFAYMIILFFSTLIVSLDELDFTSGDWRSCPCSCCSCRPCGGKNKSVPKPLPQGRLFFANFG